MPTEAGTETRIETDGEREKREMEGLSRKAGKGSSRKRGMVTTGACRPSLPVSMRGRSSCIQ